MVPADVRPQSIVARVALIAALALVAVPGVAGSRGISLTPALDSTLFHPVEIASLVRGTETASTTPDPAFRSAATLSDSAPLLEPAASLGTPERPEVAQPGSKPIAVDRNPWRYESEISFYGPGFYGRRTACGQAYTTSIMGVAHRTLPCGTRVTFRHGSRIITVPVIDRGPYVAGRTWDLSGAACRKLGHCFTGPIYWRYG